MDFNKIVEDAIQFRRELHRFPELSDEEFNTSKRIQEKLAELDIPFEKGFAGTGVLGIIEGAQDRKSTRLNSSHVAISYAVFCLKKKNNKTKRKNDTTRN